MKNRADGRDDNGAIMPPINDLTGRTFKHLKVLRADGRLGRNVAWLCRCVCGKEVRLAGYSLRGCTERRDGTGSCGCMRFAPGLRVRNDLTGRRFRTWTVLSYAGFRGGRATWLCRCDCGAQRVMESRVLRHDNGRACKACRPPPPPPPPTPAVLRERERCALLIEEVVAFYASMGRPRPSLLTTDQVVMHLRSLAGNVRTGRRLKGGDPQA